MKFQCGIDWSGKSRDGICVAITSEKKDRIYETTLFPGLGLNSTEFQLAKQINDILNRYSLSIPIIIDVPIDLTNINMQMYNSTDACDQKKKSYSLPLRDVDRYYDGMSPFSNLWGQIKRFRNTWRILNNKFKFKYILGESLFETYPAASFKETKIKHQSYKGNKVKWDGQTWQSNNKAIQQLVIDLRIYGPKDTCFYISDDEIDSIVCSLTNSHFGKNSVINNGRNCNHNATKPPCFPKGYNILGNIYWEKVIIKSLESSCAYNSK